MVHSVRTAFRDSDTSYGGDKWDLPLKPPLKGPGKGNGDAPAI